MPFLLTKLYYKYAMPCRLPYNGKGSIYLPVPRDFIYSLPVLVSLQTDRLLPFYFARWYIYDKGAFNIFPVLFYRKRCLSTWPQLKELGSVVKNTLLLKGPLHCQFIIAGVTVVKRCDKMTY